MNCQLIGPSLGPSSSRPWDRNFSSESLFSDSTRRLVQNRLALTENTKSSGVSSRHFCQLLGLKVE